MRYLVIAAHPDDEVLGAGATMYQSSLAGHENYVCIMSGKVMVRRGRPDLDRLNQNVRDSGTMLGVKQVIQGDFPNIEFNNVPHLHLVQFIEEAILESEPDIVITHHPADTNNDHLQTCLATQAAVRLFSRDQNGPPVKEVFFMEVLSATDWNINQSMNPFTPNTYVHIGKEGLDKKIAALREYEGVMRAFPHPRSQEAIEGLAAYRGGQSGLHYAEAFQCVFRREFL